MGASHPIEWIKVTGEDFVVDPKSDIVDGPFGSNLKASEYTDIGVPIARIQNVKRFKFVDKSIRFVTPEKANELQRHSFLSGDILITKLGNPLALACEVPKCFEAGIIVADLVRLRPNKKICSTLYLIYLINSEIVIKQIEKHVKGTTRPRINLSVIRELCLPFPPLAEQKVIADTLDILLAKVETTKASLERIPRTLKYFRQSVLAAAVSGKLTDEWRKENSQYKVVHDVTVDEITQIVTKGSSPKWQGISYIDDSSQTLFVTSENVGNGELLLNEPKYVEDVFNDKQKRSILMVGDVLTNIVGASIGRTAIWSENQKANINQAVCLIRLDPKKCLPEFICHYLNSPVGIEKITKNKVDVARANVSLTDIKELTLNLPSIQEQTEIVRRIEELFAVAERIEQKANAALDRVSNLTQSILAKAFRGELTANWRMANSDLISGENSAEALLEKIKSGREAFKKLPKPKRTTVKKRTGGSMSKQIIKVVEALKQAGKPLSGQQLLTASGYLSDSSTEELEQFFLDIRESLIHDKSIVKLERDNDGQDWFSLAETFA